MAIRTDWHEDADTSGSQGVDPFDLASSGAMAALLKPVSLDMSLDALRERLGSLVRREARLCERGITCTLRDNPETTCLACPLNKAGDPDSPLGMLCRVGSETEQVATTMLAKQHGGL